jgi:hypothetical protein
VLLGGIAGPTRLAMAIGLAGALTWLSGQAASVAGGFGRWQAPTNQCSFQRGPSIEARRCQVVRLEQNLEGLLSVRFLAHGSSPQGGAEQVLFAGVLEPGQPSMQCHADGRCDPRWPTSVEVGIVAAARYDERGLVTAVPQTLLARGRCDLNRARVRCQAGNGAGESWSAEATL